MEMVSLLHQLRGTLHGSIEPNLQGIVLTVDAVLLPKGRTLWQPTWRSY